MATSKAHRIWLSHVPDKSVCVGKFRVPIASFFLQTRPGIRQDRQLARGIIFISGFSFAPSISRRNLSHLGACYLYLGTGDVPLQRHLAHQPGQSLSSHRPFDQLVFCPSCCYLLPCPGQNKTWLSLSSPGSLAGPIRRPARVSGEKVAPAARCAYHWTKSGVCHQHCQVCLADHEKKSAAQLSSWIMEF